MGTGEITRYIGKYGTKRLRKGFQRSGSDLGLTAALGRLKLA